MKEEAAKVNRYSNALMIVTSIHHIYDAIIYNTPWRLHVLIISIPVILFSVITKWALTWKEFKREKLLLWIYRLVILIFSIILIGVTKAYTIMR
jgi:hypothetical protein